MLLLTALDDLAGSSLSSPSWPSVDFTCRDEGREDWFALAPQELPDNFLALPPELSDPRSAQYVVLPIAYDATATFLSGTRHGPRAVITASRQVETFDEELGDEFTGAGVATLAPLEAGSPGAAEPGEMHERVFAAARPIVSDGKFLLGLGGEHSVTGGLVRAVMTRHAALSVLQIDAHLDLRDAYEGSPWSHACVMRRVHDLGAAIVPVGIRNCAAEEAAFLREAGIEPVWASDCACRGDWQAAVLSGLGEVVYVSVDIDGFDPAFAPGTGTPEPGGLDWYQVISLLREVFRRKRVVGADIVEVMPVPGQVVTEFLAARLAYKMICYHQAGRRDGCGV